ncbi:MAG: class II glutamine amidotransferase [Prevotella sp.]|nr:class II glutamine amidotransferase [Prevotella sp.]
MCCLFGLIDYAGRFSAHDKNRIISVLSEECEVRGTDATGIAYNAYGRLNIYKRPLPAHQLSYKIPAEAKVIMGHTRMTTQGSEKLNYNNHPFFGSVDKMKFALAHNGVLYNDFILRKDEKLPQTRIQTDSYAAVQLIEKENSLDFASLKNMAEKVKGSFCFTVLNDRSDLYFIKGDNPLALYKFSGFYLYASTDEILKKALKKLNISNFAKINIDCGDILKINSDGVIDVCKFDFCGNYYGGYFCEDEYFYLDKLTEYARFFGIAPDDIMDLIDFGYDEFEIEEMLCSPSAMRRILNEIKSCEFIY